MTNDCTSKFSEISLCYPQWSVFSELLRIQERGGLRVPTLTCPSLSLRRFCRSSISASARMRSRAACNAFLLNLSVSCNSYWDRERSEKGITGIPLHFILPFGWIPLLSSDHLPGYPTYTWHQVLQCPVLFPSLSSLLHPSMGTNGKGAASERVRA